MQFPTSDSNPKLSKKQRASDRLRYLFLRAALHHTGRASVRALSQAIEMNHASLHSCISHGQCTAGIACKVEDLVGRDHTPNEWLRRPLDVVADGAPE